MPAESLPDGAFVALRTGEGIGSARDCAGSSSCWSVLAHRRPRALAEPVGRSRRCFGGVDRFGEASPPSAVRSSYTALLLAVVLIVPLLLKPLLRLAGAAVPLHPQRGASRPKLARLATSSRTTLTAGALVVGLAMVVALDDCGVRTFAGSGPTWLDRNHSRRANSSVQFDRSPSTIRSTADLAETPRREVLLADRPVRRAAQRLRQEAAAIVGQDYLDDGRLVFVSGDAKSALTAIDAGGAVIVPESLADEASPPIKVGDTLDFATGPTEATLKVVGIVAHSIPADFAEAILIGWPDAMAAFGVTGADFFAGVMPRVRNRPLGPRSRPRPCSALDRPPWIESREVGDALDRISGCSTRWRWSRFSSRVSAWSTRCR